ncbi:MAG: 3-dehydroquinate synthase [Thermoplasmata archaeon]
MDTQRFTLPINNENVSFIIGENSIKHLVEEAGKYDTVIEMVSKNVEDLYTNYIPDLQDSGPRLMKITTNDGETLKNIRNYQKVIKLMVERKIDRNSLLLYIGGGTVGDFAGFVASTYKRGIRMIAVPTTLLSQVDSSIGGKNGLNVSDVKNIIGTFYNPYMVIDDLHFLKSNKLIIREGLSEVIKYAVISGGELYEILNKNDEGTVEGTLTDLVKASIKIKSEIVNRDFYDSSGIRSILNFGHTIAHGIEGASGNKISHGIAVATGMLVEAHIGNKYGSTAPEVSESILRFMDKYGIPKISIREIGVSNIMRYIMNDKKMSEGSISMNMPSSIGNTTIVKANERILSDGMNTFIREYEK